MTQTGSLVYHPGRGSGPSGAPLHLRATLTLLVTIGGLFGLIIPMATREASKLVSELPKIKEQVVARLPQNPGLNDFIQGINNFGTGSDPQRMLGKGLGMLKTTLGGVIDGVIVFALIIYMMVDGPRAVQWWVAFFRREKRPRVTKGLQELAQQSWPMSPVSS